MLFQVQNINFLLYKIGMTFDKLHKSHRICSAHTCDSESIDTLHGEYISYEQETFNIQIETTQLHLMHHTIDLHAKGLFPIHMTTFVKVKIVQ